MLNLNLTQFITVSQEEKKKAIIMYFHMFSKQLQNILQSYEFVVC